MLESNTLTFDDIRSVRDDEVVQTIDYLLGDERFKNAIVSVIAPMTWDDFTAAMNQFQTVEEFQWKMVYSVVTRFIDRTSAGLCAKNIELVKDGVNHVFISNHRDIVLDAALLNILLFANQMQTCEIAIGDNLLVYPWIEKLVRLNKSFIVKRGVSVRQMMEVSKNLSDYIFDTVNNRKESVWIAQREGRAKDSNDKTQTSLLKMLTLHNSSQPLEALKSLNIVPLSISYELDPCDFLKAREFQLKRDNPDYVKSKADDAKSMVTGIMGFKGRICFQFAESINAKLGDGFENLNRTEVLERVAEIIDEEIYKNYTFYPFNYIAYDMMTASNRFADKYSADEKKQFEAYLDAQIDKIDLPNKDYPFLRLKIIEMYANTVKNHLSVQKQ